MFDVNDISFSENELSCEPLLDTSYGAGTSARKRSKPSQRKAEKGKSVFVGEQNNEEIWRFGSDCPILIAEIPGVANSRWNQANFTVGVFKKYFGAQPGVNGSYRLVLRNVTSDGSLGEIKVRSGVTVQSHNYRIELKKPDGFPEFSQGRSKPIGVFAKIAERAFMYILVLPKQNGHSELQDLLDKYRKSPHRLVRYQTTVVELQATVPTLPLLHYLV